MPYAVRGVLLTLAACLVAGCTTPGSPAPEAADAPIPVSDDTGQIVGAIDRKAVAHVLFGDGDAA